MADASQTERRRFQFSLRTLLFFMLGVALVAHASRFGADATGMTLLALGSTCGAVMGRKRLLSALLCGAIGGALSMWIGLLYSMLVPNDAVYSRFVREQFIGLSLFVMAEGALVGTLIGALVRSLYKLVQKQRTRCPVPQDSANNQGGQTGSTDAR